MKFQVIKTPWCNEVRSKWTIVQLNDSTPLPMGTVRESSDGTINAFVESNGSTLLVEFETVEALYKGMFLIAEHQASKNPAWRKDFGQI